MFLSIFVLTISIALSFSLTRGLIEALVSQFGLSQTRRQNYLIWTVAAAFAMCGVIGLSSVMHNMQMFNFADIMFVVSLIGFFLWSIVGWKDRLEYINIIGKANRLPYPKLSDWRFIPDTILRNALRLGDMDDINIKEIESFMKGKPDGKYFYTGTDNPTDEYITRFHWNGKLNISSDLNGGKLPIFMDEVSVRNPDGNL